MQPDFFSKKKLWKFRLFFFTVSDFERIHDAICCCTSGCFTKLFFNGNRMKNTHIFSVCFRCSVSDTNIFVYTMYIYKMCLHVSCEFAQITNHLQPFYIAMPYEREFSDFERGEGRSDR